MVAAPTAGGANHQNESDVQGILEPESPAGLEGRIRTIHIPDQRANRPMNYREITQQVPGSGVQEYSQGAKAVAARIDIGNGICRALTVMWLRAKKDNGDFWQRDDIAVQPLKAAESLRSAVNLQAEYARVLESRYVPDTATKNSLAQSGLTYRQEDVVASAQWGFAQRRPNDESAKICARVLSAKSRFFILSVKGTDGAHSIGMFRPYALMGKSSTMHLFDPNIGEFKVSGATTGEALLAAVNQQGYGAIGVDLNKQYILWSFAD